MPRKKASALPAPSPSGPERIVCPACKSEISADGSTLHAMSEKLEEMIEAAGSVEKFEKAIETLDAKYKAEKQAKEKALADLEAATKTKQGEIKDGISRTVGQEQGKPSRGNWW